MFEKEQRVVRVAGVSFGGQPSENPVVMVGSLFYRGHKAVTDHRRGAFDRKVVEGEVQTVLEWSDKTGLPVAFDLVAQHADALKEYVSFAADSFDAPFLVDGTNDEVRLPAMEAAAEWGLLDRAILNSIDAKATDASLAEYKALGVRHAVLLAFESRALLPEKKLSLLTSVEGKVKGLVQKAGEAGIRDFLVDVAVLDVPSMAFCARTQQLVKERHGYPVGCAPANAVFEWERARGLFGREGRWSCAAAACVFLADWWADFILYGPARLAPQIFPAVATREAIGAYYQRRINRVDVRSDVLQRLF